jgi:hypothetical protein
MWIAGEYDDPRAYLNSQVQDLLPVVIEPAEAQGFQGDTTRMFRPLIEDPANPHEIVRLAADPSATASCGRSRAGSRDSYWYWPVTRAKPGSQVLLRHPTDGRRGERYPLLVAGYFPAGRTLFCAMDSIWRWRFHHLAQHERFWRNAVRWLALGRSRAATAAGARGRTLDLQPRRARDGRGARARRGLPARARPTSQDVRWSDPDGKASDLKLAAVPGKPGVFPASFEPARLACTARGWRRTANASRTPNSTSSCPPWRTRTPPPIRACCGSCPP